jgi:glycosyltransferase involved in cell wall biosynthesis
MSVSVVITTYNHARYLGAAIESIAAQTVAPSEVIVVDDGSADDPEEVTRQYSHVRLIRQENQGLPSARNTGWRAASGCYVVFLDADDRLLPNALQANLERFAAQPECGFVYGAYRHVVAGVASKDEPLRRVGGEPYVMLLKDNVVAMHGTVMYRRDRLEEIGGFDPTLRACEDYDVYLRLARSFPVACGPECIAEYHHHSSNMSHDIPKMLVAARAVLRKQETGVRGNPIWRAAYNEGVATWTTKYATIHVGNVLQALKARSVSREVARQTVYLLYLAPLTVSRIAIAEGARLLRKHLRASKVRLGDLRRTTPISAHFGFDRGKPVDRRYIEDFLASNTADIRGRVLEIGDNSYTVRFGSDRVERSDVFNRYPGDPQTTFTGDLAEHNNLPSEAFDCIILTQTLHLIFDMPEAVRTLWRILRPGGALLVTVPWVSPIDRDEWGTSWYWSLSPAALRRLLEMRFGVGQVDIVDYGNVLSATAFLYGLAEHELSGPELDARDPYCPVIVAGRAIKAA